MALDKQDQDLLNDKNTVVVIPDFGPEYTIAIKWLRANAQKVISEQRVFTQLVLSALQTDITIVTLAREFSNTSPIQMPQQGLEGKVHYYPRSDAELQSEVQMSEPIKVSKYWIRDNPMRPGRPDTAAILEALGKECGPWRLDFIDKGEDKPEVLALVKG